MTKTMRMDTPFTKEMDGSLKEVRDRLLKEQRELQLHKFLRNKLSVVGFVIVVTMLTLAILAPVLAQCDPLALDMKVRLKGPSAAHWFGTDSMGRDLFARVLYGARISMFVGFTVGITSGFLGMMLGLYATTNKYLDNILMRFCDGLKAIPSTLLAITLMTVLGEHGASCKRFCSRRERADLCGSDEMLGRKQGQNSLESHRAKYFVSDHRTDDFRVCFLHYH